MGAAESSYCGRSEGPSSCGSALTYRFVRRATAGQTVSADTGSLQDALDRAAEARIRSALATAAGRRTEAAAALGVERTTLYRLMKRLGIDQN